MHITRHTMYESIFSNLDLPIEGEILAISGIKFWSGSKNYTSPQKIIADTAKITDADYPEVNICKLPYNDNKFDYVICDQVIEHIEGSVPKAIDEVRRVLKPRGIAVVATVFINPVHYGPKDMWRFSPDALRFMLKDFSEIIECSGWGNRFAHALFFLYPKSRNWQVKNRPWNVARILAARNDPKYPGQTWIIARK
jgi:SAM-dependent methyltransferase